MCKAFQRVRSMRLCKPGRTLRVRLDMGGTGISKSEVSRLCADIDTKVNAFLQRPVEGDWPYLWIDATWLKVRESHRIVSVAVIIAVAVNTDGRREVIGMATGPSEAETFWTDFLRSLLRRGLRGVKLVISDAHAGIQAAVSKVMNATWQRCRVQFASRRLRRHAQCACPCQGRAAQHGRRHAAHDLRPGQRAGHPRAMGQGDRQSARPPSQARPVDGRCQGGCSRLHRLSEGTLDQDLLDQSAGRADGEIKRRTNVVGIFPNDQSIIRLAGAILLEQNDEWAVQNRYMTLATLNPIGDTDRVSLPALPD